MATPATGALIGTPASMSDSDVPHTLAIELEPFDSRISDTTRITYGKAVMSGITALTPRRARLPCPISRRFGAGAERGQHQSLGFPAGEERRPVRARHHADLDRDRAYGARVAPVDARLAVEDPLAHDAALEPEERALDGLLGPLGLIPSGERRE